MLNTIRLSSLVPDSNVITKLVLKDYEWMTYKLSAKIETIQYGNLTIKFNSCGTTTSDMKVISSKDRVVETYTYTYDTNLFDKHISRYLTNHILSFISNSTFNGENDVINFYNDVIKYGKIVY